MDLTPDAKRAFTVQSYAPQPRIEGVEIVDLQRHVDDGGSMTELARLTAGGLAAVPGFPVHQMDYSGGAPRAIQSVHLHPRQTGALVVPPPAPLPCRLD